MSFHSITSFFTENGPGSGGGDDYEAAYDIWAGTGSHGYAQEIMIRVDNHGQTPAGCKAGTPGIAGARGGSCRRRRRILRAEKADIRPF